MGPGKITTGADTRVGGDIPLTLLTHASIGAFVFDKTFSCFPLPEETSIS